ncbi:diacylglycerol kinase [Amycolatopsis marina]|uniref:Diacylglycerol kinase n=1 Tax=Amycolatopsis marina TaxID=490629 RepID=A0A1I1BX39_9PSEU|nr:diacylglycerol kinase family protein [Amycolatopsis marina]SFB54995.1 diacylglycerol kinase [Amycolatopsis marina]
MGVHAALAVHPDSGRGAAARIAGTVADRLRAAVDRLDLLVATSVAESQALMARSHEDGLDVLVVLGGDGAAHQGVQFCAGSGTALALVPSGTGNDLARALGVDRDPLRAVDEVVAALADGRRRRIDLGRLGDTWFSTVLCAGFDAAVNERANRMRWPAGPRRYDLAILGELAAFRPRHLVVDTGARREEFEATLVAIGNTAWYGGGVPICPEARPDDGVFDVTVVGRASRRELLRMLPSLRTGRHVRYPGVHTMRAVSVELSGSEWPVYADGEALGQLPITARSVPGALTVVG